MCFKYEGDYRRCFDFLMFNDGFQDTDMPTLLGQFGAEVTDNDKFRDMLFEMFERMHERGIIKPAQKE